VWFGFLINKKILLIFQVFQLAEIISLKKFHFTILGSKIQKIWTIESGSGLVIVAGLF